ncbi:MAG: bis(5'-nucleosyl)-tetraphosphatase (symmetrical) YqeK [Atopobiaceae bacterium]
MPDSRWDIPRCDIPYTDEQREEMAKLEHDIKVQLAEKPKRLAHSLSVARTAEWMAKVYGVDCFEARCAGILHDWVKAETHEQQMEEATRLGIDLGAPLDKVEPLLHGLIAAHTLPRRYPELPESVWQAISRHTTGAADMSDLDMVLFVADGIEPLRKPYPGIDNIRGLVGTAPLSEVFWASFAGGIVYVIETRRYLYPGTVDIYNALVEKEHA